MIFGNQQKAQQKAQEIAKILEDNKNKLEEIQNLVADMIKTKTGSKQVEVTALIVATILNGFDERKAQKKVLELANQIIKTQR